MKKLMFSSCPHQFLYANRPFFFNGQSSSEIDVIYPGNNKNEKAKKYQTD